MSDHSSSAGPLSPKKFELLRQMLKNKGIQHTSATTGIPQRSTDGPLPLSFAQQRLWFLDQLQPNSPLYNIPAVLDLAGPLDHAALREALHTLIARHEVLRTAFPANKGQPVQQIAPRLSLELPLFDLAALPDVARDHEAARLARAEAEAPFDLATGPLLRATLLRLAPDQHRLLLTLHHTISDGWSNHVLVRDLAAAYRAARTAQPLDLPPLPIQYADFALWQREWLQGEVLERQLSYWQQQLAGAPPVLDLPTDFARPPIQRFHGGLLADRLDPALTAQIQDACHATGTTLYMFLLTAWSLLLARWSGQDQIVVGSPVASRTQPELTDLIGFFANTLVLRTDLHGNPTVRELLHRVHQTTLAAQEHQDVPFELLVERLQPVRDPSRNPLFQVMFVLQNTPAAAIGSDALTFTMQEYTYTGTAKFDLWLSATERGGGLDLLLEYNADLYTEATAQRLLAQVVTVVRSLVADVEQPIRAVTVLPDAERRRILEQWTATTAPYPHDQCIHDLVAAQAARTPDALAVRFEQQQLTYAELERRANQVAHRLHALGVGPDVRVGVALERSLELVVGVLGILKAGGAYVPIDPRYPAERIAYMLEDAQAPVLLTQRWLQDQLPPPTAQVVTLDPQWHALADLPTTPLHSGVTPAHPAYVTYTSGSTGRPKGCVMPHRPLVNLLHWQLNYAPLPQGSRFLQFASLSFDVSYQEIFPNLCNGNCVVMITEALRRNLDALLDFVIEARLDAMYLPMVALQQLAEIAEYKGVVPTTLREVMVSGEQLVITPAVVRLFQQMPHCRLHNLYGPTETHAVTAYTLPDDPASWPAVVPIGRPIANTHMYVLDNDFQPTPIGVPGELYIGGDCVSDGYLNRPELTAERFIITPISRPEGTRPGARVYKTGDAARYLADGNLVFLGRLDHQVKIRGFRVELEEIEAVLNQHEAVRENTVIVREDTPGDKRLVAYVVLQRDISTHELRLFVQAKQPDYMVPAVFVVLDRLPLTSNGKVDRKALPAPDHLRPDLTSSYVAPRTPTEQTVAAIWADVLQLEKVGVDDNFFELGGHSLNATQVVSRIREALQIDLPLYTLFQSPTVADLCQAIEQGQDLPQ